MSVRVLWQQQNTNLLCPNLQVAPIMSHAAKDSYKFAQITVLRQAGSTEVCAPSVIRSATDGCSHPHYAQVFLPHLVWDIKDRAHTGLMRMHLQSCVSFSRGFGRMHACFGKCWRNFW